MLLQKGRNKMNREEKLTRKAYSDMVKREWSRLVRDPYHKLEFDTTIHYLKKYLPKKGLILDAGGGPGRYTIELARLGYNIVLLDLVKGNLDEAREQIRRARAQNRVKGIVEGSIVDMSVFKDNSFDAVICLGGPLSHVSPEKSRSRAVSELRRVAKKGAPIFISVMGKFGTLSSCPRRFPGDIAASKNHDSFIKKGDDYLWIRKHYCHFFTRDELIKVISRSLSVIQVVGLEGLATPDPEAFNNMARDYPQAYRNWMKYHYQLSTNPTVVDMSGHMLIIARKK